MATPNARDRPIRFGILGLGKIAATMARAIALTPGAELAAVASRSPERARAFAETHNVPISFGAYAELAGCPEVDVAYVATPPSRHLKDVLLCLDQGKHVLCEKPFALSAEDARVMAAEGENRRLFVMEAMWTRFLPAVARLQEVLDANGVGQPQMLVAGGAFQPEVDPDYYLFNPALGGGVMRDAGVYLLHLARWIMGPIALGKTMPIMGPMGVDETNGALLRHDGGGLSVLYVSMRAKQPPFLEVLGDQGSVTLHPPVFNPSRVEWRPRIGTPQSWSFEGAETGYGFQIAEVVDCVRRGLTESPRMPLSLTIEIAGLLETASP